MTIQEELHKRIPKGARLTNTEVKTLLTKIYQKHDIDKKPKTTDLLLFGFKTKRCAITILDEEKTRQEGIKIL